MIPWTKQFILHELSPFMLNFWISFDYNLVKILSRTTIFNNNLFEQIFYVDEEGTNHMSQHDN